MDTPYTPTAYTKFCNHPDIKAQVDSEYQSFITDIWIDNPNYLKLYRKTKTDEVVHKKWRDILAKCEILVENYKETDYSPHDSFDDVVFYHFREHVNVQAYVKEKTMKSRKKPFLKSLFDNEWIYFGLKDRKGLFGNIFASCLEECGGGKGPCNGGIGNYKKVYREFKTNPIVDLHVTKMMEVRYKNRIISRLWESCAAEDMHIAEDTKLIYNKYCDEDAFELAYEEGFKRGVELYKTAIYIRPLKRILIKYIYRPDGLIKKKKDEGLNIELDEDFQDFRNWVCKHNPV